MSLLSDWSERLQALLFRRRRETELDEELRYHVDRETEERIRTGADPATAHRQALLAFGGIERFKEEVRDARGVRPVEDFVADTRYALRGLRASPGFALSAIAVLGLALGATTIVFTIADRVLFTELPYPAADRLVRVYLGSGANRWSLSVVDAQAIRDQQRSFDAFGIISLGDAALSGVGRPEQITVGRATAGFFAALGAQPAAGRLVLPSDESAGAAPVAVITDRMARDRMGGARSAVGRSITVDGISHVVVGVLAPGVDDLAAVRAQAWIPLKLETPTRRGPFWLRGIGRLAPGRSLPEAAVDLGGISQRIFPIWAAGYRDQAARYVPVPLREAIVGRATRQVGLFAAAVLLVLLVAVANVATLMLVRASAREQEMAVRQALGAGKGRLARLLVTDGLVLTVAAGLVGLAIAAAGVELTVALVRGLPRIHEVQLGPRSLLFTALVTLVAGLAVGAPALIASLAGPTAGSLRLDTRRVGTGRRSSAVRSGLVIAEFALAFPLLVGAGLLLQSFIRLGRVDPGFDPRGVVSTYLSLPNARYPTDTLTGQFWQRLEARVAGIPGVTAVGMTLNLPPDEPVDVNNFNLVDHPVPEGGNEPVVPWSTVTPGYLQALGIPLLAGRTFTAADTGAGENLLVSRSWARRYYPGESPLGKQLVSGGCYTCPVRSTVVGVVGDVKYLGLSGEADAVYNVLGQASRRSMNVVVKSRLGDEGALAAVRQAVAALDPELPVVETTMARRLERSLDDPRRWTSVLGGFAAIAIVLAALGVFGLMSYAVRQRRREIGVRLALGAAPTSVTAMIIRRGLAFALLGTALGLGLTIVVSRWLVGFLYGVTPTDPVTVAGVALLLLATAGLACWLPGRQAARIPPIEAISTE
jgi:predicted permease